MPEVHVRLSQGFFSQRALMAKRALESSLEAAGLDNPFRRGTPPRKHKITDRAARKALARQRTIDAILNDRTIAAEPDLCALDFAWIEQRVLAATPRYGVEEYGDGWWVVDVTAGVAAVPVRGPYQAKKTANRVARTLNGG